MYTTLRQPPPFAPPYPSSFYTCQPQSLLTWSEFPSTVVPGLLSTAHPLLLHPPQGTPWIKLHIYIDDINNISRLVYYKYKLHVNTLACRAPQ
jgi:hypothetical protein